MLSGLGPFKAENESVIPCSHISQNRMTAGVKIGDGGGNKIGKTQISEKGQDYANAHDEESLVRLIFGNCRPGVCGGLNCVIYASDSEASCMGVENSNRLRL